MNEQETDKLTVIERHAQTIMVGLVTVGIIFVSTSITNQNADIKVLQSQVQDLKEFVRQTQGGYVTTSEFEIHQQEINRRLQHLERPAGDRK